MTSRFISLALLVSCYAHAGILVQSTQTVNEPGAKISTASLYFNGDDLRVESAEEGDTSPNVVLIYQSVRQMLFTLSPDKKTYTKMTKAQLEQMGSLLSNAIKLLPKSQLQALEKSTGIKGLASGAKAKAPKITYTATGKKEKIGIFTCSRLVGSSDGKRVGEICAVPYKDLGVQPDDFRVMRTFADLLTKMNLGALVQTEFLRLWNQQQTVGYPVESVFYEGNEWKMKSVTRKVEKRAFTASLFTPPADYTEKPLTIGMPGAAPKSP